MSNFRDGLPILLLCLCATLGSCGLHGTRAEFLGTEGEYFLFTDWSGRELRLQGHEGTRKEPDLAKGDQVQVYFTDQGMVDFIVKP